MWFWVKHLAAAIILIVLAAVLLLFPEKFQTVTPKLAMSRAIALDMPTMPILAAA